ncbi:MAG: hypothetical protein AAFX40_13105, partial [Cyanobacteria bacterium J06639_1]
MPAPTGSPYRSKFVTFAVEQTQRWKRRAGVAVRWAKAGLMTGVQWLLHPVYLLSQASRWTGRTLQNAAATQLLTAGKTDRDRVESFDSSVQRILDVARIHVPQAAIAPTQKPSHALEAARSTALQAPESVRNNVGLTRASSTSATQTRRSVRGLACQISDRDLVLIDDCNCSLNCLSPAQQALLNHQIELALAGRIGRSSWRLPGVLKFLSRDRTRPQLTTSEPSLNRLPLATSIGKAIATLRDRVRSPKSDLAAASSDSNSAAKSSGSLTALIRAAWEYFAEQRSPASLPQASRSQRSATASPLAKPKPAKSLGLPIPPTLLSSPLEPPSSANPKRDRALHQAATVLKSLPAQPKLNVKPVRRSVPVRSVARAVRPVLISPRGRTQLQTTLLPGAAALVPGAAAPVALQKSPSSTASGRQSAARVIAEAWADMPARMAVVPVSQSPVASAKQPRSRISTHQSKPASQQAIETRATSLGYDQPWQQRVLDRVDRAAYGVETAAESAGDRARAASQNAWHHVERRVPPIRDRDFTDRLQNVIWAVLTAIGAGIVTFAEVLLPLAIGMAIRALRLVAILSWMFLRGSLALLAMGLSQLIDYIER